MLCPNEVDGGCGRGGVVHGGDQSSAKAAAGYRALGGQRGAAGGGEAHRAARKMARGGLVAAESMALIGDASGIRGRRRGRGSVRGRPPSCILTGRRSRGWRSERTRRRGLEVAVAVSSMAAIERRAPGWTGTTSACIKGVVLLLVAYATCRSAKGDGP